VLVPVLVLVAIMSIITEAVLTIGLVQARIAVKDKAAMYAEIALDRSIAEHLEFVRGAVHRAGTAVVTAGSSGGDPNGFVDAALMRTFHHACVDVTTTSEAPLPCPMRYAVQVETTGTTAGGATGTGAGPASSNSLAVTFVEEQKVAEVLTVTMEAPDGTVLAERSRLITMRVFDNQPFVALTGVRDVATSAISGTSGVGDSSGTLTTLDGELATAAVPAANDTAIRVITTCQQRGRAAGDTTGAPVSGDPIASEGFRWGANGGFGVEVPCDAADLPTHAHTSLQWDTGTENADALSR